MFVISRLFFIYLVMSRVKKIVNETEDFVISGFHQWPIPGFHCTKVKSSRVSQACAIKNIHIWKEVMKPFITLLPGMNCLQVKRNVSYIHTYIFN